MSPECRKERLIVEGLFDDETVEESVNVQMELLQVIPTHRSKIITAGVIKVAEPAATRVSATMSSPSRLRLRWIPSGICLSCRFWFIIDLKAYVYGRICMFIQSSPATIIN